MLPHPPLFAQKVPRPHPSLHLLILPHKPSRVSFRSRPSYTQGQIRTAIISFLLPKTLFHSPLSLHSLVLASSTRRAPFCSRAPTRKGLITSISWLLHIHPPPLPRPPPFVLHNNVSPFNTQASFPSLSPYTQRTNHHHSLLSHPSDVFPFLSQRQNRDPMAIYFFIPRRFFHPLTRHTRLGLHYFSG